MLEIEVVSAETEALILLWRAQSVQYLKLENMRARERQKERERKCKTNICVLKAKKKTEWQTVVFLS